jgi:uncharacterized protein (TIGR03435 family)
LCLALFAFACGAVIPQVAAQGSPQAQTPATGAASTAATGQPPATQSPAASSDESDWEIAAGGRKSFDVASVKQNNTPQGPGTVHSNVPLGPQNLFTPTGGLFTTQNFPVLQYIIFAYKLTPNQTDSIRTQLPKWATSDRYDIEARAVGNPTKDQYRLMMQDLLAARFKLALHHETKQQPVLALVLDKPGKLGPHLQLHPLDQPCPTTVPTGGGPIPTIAGGFPEPCGAFGAWPSTSNPGQLTAGARNMPMSMIATTFSISQISGADKPVIDRTGLTGNYDFVFSFSPELPPGADFQADPNGPTFLEAIKDQLGLKLEQQTGPVETIVIDHIEQPSEN